MTERKRTANALRRLARRADVRDLACARIVAAALESGKPLDLGRRAIDRAARAALLDVARHEALHAVVARAFGVRVYSATIEDLDDAHVSVGWPWPRKGRPTRGCVARRGRWAIGYIKCSVGPVEWERTALRPEWRGAPFADGDFDVEDSLEALRPLERDRTKRWGLLHQLALDVRPILAVPRVKAAADFVVGELLRHGKLTGARLKRVLGRVDQLLAPE